MKFSVLAIRSFGLTVRSVDMNFMSYWTTCVAHNGVSIVIVASYAKILLATSVTRNLLHPIRWPFTGPSKMKRCLVRYLNDPIRNAGLIVEIVDMPFNPRYLASKKRNIVHSVRINSCVRRNVRYAWISHVPPMNAWKHHGLLIILLRHETSFSNPIKRSSLIASCVIINIRQRPIIIIIRMDHVRIVQTIFFVRERIVPLAFKNHLPRIPKSYAGIQPIPWRHEASSKDRRKKHGLIVRSVTPPLTLNYTMFLQDTGALTVRRKQRRFSMPS